jgi:hypothetical protein
MVRCEGEQWKLPARHRPYFIKGAGGSGSLAKLKQAGGNSLRTWGTDGLQCIFDDARQHGLTV